MCYINSRVSIVRNIVNIRHNSRFDWLSTITEVTRSLPSLGDIPKQTLLRGFGGDLDLQHIV